MLLCFLGRFGVGEDFQKFAWEQTDPKTRKKLIGDALSMADFIAYMNKTMKNDPNESNGFPVIYELGINDHMNAEE